MATVYRIEGLHCGNCAANVQRALEARGIAAKVTVEPPQVHIVNAEVARRDDIAATVAATGDYKLGEEMPAATSTSALLWRLKNAFKGI
jgi:copper chaperone CopZ